MGEYKVVLMRQKLVVHRLIRRPRADWTDLYKEVHRVVAHDVEEAVEKAKALASWVNKQDELRGHERVELFAIYELRPDGSAHEIPIAARF